ncbi:cca trna mitochondrial [Fusarium avenaceum]|nr:cca trna mitochondrial [Fusarium avenaceum]
MKRNFDSFLKEQPSLPSNSLALSTVPPQKVHLTPSRIPKSTMVTTTIQLTPKEQQLRHLLLDVAKAIDDAGQASEPIVLRWAGGWVRDKLLNIQSHDIDVAINAMTGVPFAQAMCDYCEGPEAMAKHNIGPADIGNLHNVARNPEKSKHLETAMVKMFGLDLDFVNLRKETYTEDSRNPQMEFGTAEEDARRRDATVNALFYNLHDDCVEDFTGGLPDMDAKIIRTPLEPFQTFMDDPLRVLRLVRFASRLQFTIDENTRKFMADPKVLEALRVKISRERVGVELEKMLKGAHPYQALEFIDNLHLFHAIFTDPTQENLPVPDVSRLSVTYTCLDELLKDQSSTSVASRLITSGDAPYLAWNLAALSPWMMVEDPPNPRKKPSSPPLVATISREGFKAPNKLSDIVSAAHRHREEIMELKNAVCAGKPIVQERDRFGMAIRKWDSPAGTWRLQILNALLVEALETLPEWRRDGSAKQESFLAGWISFLDHMAKLDVYEAPSLKAILNGRELAQALGTKPGKWTGQALEVVLAWQFRNPGETDPAGAIEEVQEQRKELGIP